MQTDPGDEISDAYLAEWIELAATAQYLRRPDLMPPGDPQFFLRAAAQRIRTLSGIVKLYKEDPIGMAHKDLHPE